MLSLLISEEREDLQKKRIFKGNAFIRWSKALIVVALWTWGGSPTNNGRASKWATDNHLFEVLSVCVDDRSKYRVDLKCPRVARRERDAIIGSNLMDIDHPRILLEIIDGQVVDYTRNKSFHSKLPSLGTPISIRRRWSRNSRRNNLKFTFEIENLILFTNRRSLNWNNLPFAVATESRATSPALLTERVGQTSQIEARQEVWVS